MLGGSRVNRGAKRARRSVKARQAIAALTVTGLVVNVAGAANAASTASNGGTGPVASAMHPHSPAAMPKPHSAVGVYAPPSSPAKTVPKVAAGKAGTKPAAQPTEGWTSFSHWKSNGNGSVTAEFYKQPEFRHTASGWVKIDPRVHAKDGTAAAGAEGAVRPIRFGSSAKDLVQFALDGGTVSLVPEGLSIGSPTVVPGGVKYSNVAPDTDLVYTVSRGGLKEDLVLGSSAAPHTFSFHLSDPKNQLGAASPLPGGGYRFANRVDGDVAVDLPAPVAYRQEPSGVPPAASAGSAHMALTRSGDGYDMTVSVDPAWAAKQTYPIVLDPTVSLDSPTALQPGSTAFSSQCASGTGNGGCVPATQNTNLDVGTYTDSSVDYEPARSVFQVDLSSIPNGSSISAATFNAYVQGCVGEPDAQNSSNYKCNSSNYVVELHQFDQSWGFSNTYDQLNTMWDSTAFSSLSQPAFNLTYANNACSGCFWENFNVASEVQNWISERTPNYGFVAKLQNEAYNIGGPGWAFNDPNFTNITGNPQPYISVTYDPAPGPPSNVVATAGNAQATVTWNPSSTNGGSAISKYTVYTAVNGTLNGQSMTVCGTCTSATVTGLTNGTTYEFAVFATNADGLTGDGYSSNSVVPEGVPNITKVVKDLDNPTPLIASRGQTLQYTVTVTNPEQSAMNLTLSDVLPSRDLVMAPRTAVTLNGALCSATTSPACTLADNPTNVTLSVSQFSLPAGQTDTFVYDAVAQGSDQLGCKIVQNTATAVNGSFGSTSASAPTPVCDGGLGIEPWWSYITKTLGSGQNASVNAANGNLVVQATDSTEITGHGHLGFVLRRAYNSQDSTVATLPGSLGHGWNFNVAQADDLATAGITATGLYVPSDEQITNPLAVTMIDRDGTRLVFTPSWTSLSATTALDVNNLTGALTDLVPHALSLNTQGGFTHLCVDETYTAPPGVHLALWRYIETTGSSCADLSKNASGVGPVVLGYAAIRPDRLRYEFQIVSSGVGSGLLGELVDMTDGNGVDLHYTYNGTQLSRVYQPCDPTAKNCKAYNFAYPSSTETDVTDPAGRVTKYLFYNNTATSAPLGNYLTQVVNPDGSTLNYTYSGVNGTASCGSTTGQLCSVTDLDGNKTGFSYTGSTLALPAGATVAFPSLLTAITDRLGTKTTVAYASDNSWATATTGNELTTYKSIDSSGRVGEIQDADTSNNLYHDSFYTWDSASRTCQQGTPSGASGIDNNLCELKRSAFAGSNGATTPDEDTTYVYNTEGQTLDKRQQTGTGALDTTYGYKAEYFLQSSSGYYTDTVAGSGNVTSQQRPAGSATNPVIYAISDRTQSLTPVGNAAGSGYTAYVTTYQLEDGLNLNPNAVPAANPCTENVRGGTLSPADNSGDLCETDAPYYDGTHPTITSYTYDTYGQKLSMTNPNGNLYQYAYYSDDDLDMSGTTSAGGWLKTVTDPNNQYVAYGYDAAGDVIYTWDRNATARNHANNPSITINSYPGTPGTSGNPSCGTGLPGGYTTDQYGPYAGSSALWCAAPWRYLLVHTDALGNQTKYAVDANGNQITITSARGNNTTQKFNAADELTSKITPVNQSSGKATTWTYDQYGNKASMTDPNGIVTVYGYDPVNRLTTTEFTRGPSTGPAVNNCRASTSSDAPIPSGRILCTTTITYDGVDNAVTARDANGQNTTQHYDGVHRVTDTCAPANVNSGASTGVCADAPYSASIASLHTGYIYDPDGNKTDICNPREFTDGGQTACVANPAYGTHMTYDGLDRVTTKTVGRLANTTETTSYTYDADGNQTAVKDPNGHTTTYGYDSTDRKTSMTVPFDAPHSYSTYWTYDPSGDVTSETQPGSLNLGSGANGALLVDGASYNTSSTPQYSNTHACTQANPCAYPTDFVTSAQGGNFTTVTLQNSAYVTVSAYNGSTGGSLTWQATGAVSICAMCHLTLDAKGPGGGAGGTSVTGSAAAGGGNGPGGGGGNNATTGGGGGGAGHANRGGAGTQHISGDGAPGGAGGSYGSLSGAGVTGQAAMGSGGGGGGDGATTHGGNGGSGGGAIRISAQSIDDEGFISANGNPGATISGLTGGGGGGGGSGGSVWLTSPAITLAAPGSIAVNGGNGGGGGGSDNGGNGSAGLVRLDTNAVTGAGAGTWTAPNAAVIIPVGRVTAYSYDNDNRVYDTVTGADSTNAANAATSDGTKNVRTRDFYDQDGNLVAQLLPGAFATSVSSPNNAYLVRTDYDVSDRPITTFKPRYDSTHAEPGLSSIQASQCPSPPRLTPVSLTNVPNYPSGVGVCVTQMSYDPAGNLAKVVLPTSNGSDNRYVTYAYTDDNLLSSVNAPNPAADGSQQEAASYQYDADGKQTTQTLVPSDSGHAQSTTTSYYPNEQVYQTADQGYTVGTTQITHVTTDAYNADGKTVTATDPMGNATTTGYTNDDLTASVTDGAGDKTSYSYDGTGNPLTITSPSANAKDATNPSGTPTSYTYNWDNLPLTQTVPVAIDGSSLRQTSYNYDQGGRKTSLTTNLVNSSGTVTSAGPTQTFNYFNDDRMASQANGSQQITYSYDPAGNQTAVTDSTSGVTIAASYYLDELPLTVNDGTRCSQFTYDGQGQPVARADGTYSGGACSTTGRYVTTYNYGDAEQLNSMTSAAAANGTTTYTYSDLGQALTDSLPNNLSVSSAFNPDGTLSTQTESGSSGTVAQYSYSYNNNAEITSQTLAGKGATTNGTFNSDTLSYNYDGANRIASFVDQGTQTVTNNISYDHDGNRLGYGPGDNSSSCTASTTTTCFTYNADNSIHQATDANGTHAYAYTVTGDLQSDACDSYNYDGFDRLTQANPSGASGCPTGQTATTYTYDGLDRQHSSATTTASTNLHYNGLSSNVSDETNNTTSVDTIYALTPVGSKTALTQETPGVTTTQYLTSDGNNNISTVTDSSGNPACTVRYDPYGNPLGAQSTSICNTGSTLDTYFYQNARRDPTTGQYQLGTRTYDPAKASYLSPDTYRTSQPAADQTIHTDPLTGNTYTYVNGNPLNFNDPDGHCAKAVDDSQPINCSARPIPQSPSQQQYEAQQYRDFEAEQQTSNSIDALIGGGLPGHPLAPGAYTTAGLRSVTAVAPDGQEFTFGLSVLEARNENLQCSRVTNSLSCDQAYQAAVCVAAPTRDCLAASPQGAEPQGFTVPPSSVGSAALSSLPLFLPSDLAFSALSNLFAVGRSSELTQEEFQALIQRYGREYATQGFAGLQGKMTQPEIDAYLLNPSGGSRFLGTAVHRSVRDQLYELFGEEAIGYSPNRGPDFTYIPGGFQVELTTEPQLFVHQARADYNAAYAQALYATYSW